MFGKSSDAMDDMTDGNNNSPGVQLFSPGMVVRHPGEEEWGLGQVQSAIGHRVTVNFQNVGKQLIDTAVIDLEVVDGTRR